MIHLILGRQGSGKTLFLVKRAWDIFNGGGDIYSKVHLNFPYSKLKYEAIIDCKLNHGMVLLAEID